jgi:antitoxin ParD1/3/4
MTQQLQTAIERLKALPEDAQDEVGERLNRYLNRLEELRELIQEGLESGPTRPADEVFSRLEAKYQEMQLQRGQGA